MCLTLVTSRPTPSDEPQVAWKAFDVTATGELMFQFRDFRKSVSVPRGQWLQAEITTLKVDERTPMDVEGGKVLHFESYLSGFHCFPTEEGAATWSGERGDRRTTQKVLVKSIRTIGEQRWLGQEHGTVLVADHMYVPAEGEDI